MYNLVVFASGNGTTLQSIIDAIQEKKLEANISLVVSNNPKAYAIERAKKANIQTYLIKEKNADKIDAELERYIIQIRYQFNCSCRIFKTYRKKTFVKIHYYQYTSFPTP